VSKRNNNQGFLKGVYEDNLRVSGKADAQSFDHTSSETAVAQKSRSVLLAVAIVAIVVTVYLLIEFVLSAQVDSHTLSNISANYAAEVGKGNPIAKNDIAAKAKALQKKLHDVDNLESQKQEQRKQVAIDQAKYQVLTQSGVPLAQLFGLTVRTIVIDPGHGGKDPGTIGKSGIREKDVSLAIAKLLKEKLLAYSGGQYKVLMTREDDNTIALSDRVDYANANNADLFISIHINASGSKQNFIETYYFGATSDKNSADLAQRENVDSNYEYGEFKEIIQKIGDTLKYQESRQLAHSVQTSLFGRMKRINKHASDHGIKSAPFVVLLGLDAPSILTEVSCFCNQTEEKRLKTAEYRDKIATFLEKGIVSYLNNNTSVGGKRNGEKEKLAKAQQ